MIELSQEEEFSDMQGRTSSSSLLNLNQAYLVDRIH